MGITIGTIRMGLAGFAKGIEAKGKITDYEKKITIPGGASFTPKEIVDLDRILGYFPADIDLGALAALQGALARAMYITGMPMEAAYGKIEDVAVPVVVKNEGPDAA